MAAVNFNLQDVQLSFELLPSKDFPPFISQSDSAASVDSRIPYLYVTVYCRPLFEAMNEHNVINLKEYAHRFTLKEDEVMSEAVNSMTAVYPEPTGHNPSPNPVPLSSAFDNIGIIVNLNLLREYQLEHGSLDGQVNWTFNVTLIDTEEGDTQEFPVTQEYKIEGTTFTISKADTELHSFDLTPYLAQLE